MQKASATIINEFYIAMYLPAMYLPGDTGLVFHLTARFSRAERRAFGMFCFFADLLPFREIRGKGAFDFLIFKGG